MAQISGSYVAQVNEYRAYIAATDGHFISCRSFVCGNDADALVWAKQLLDHNDVELWSGDRLVARLKATEKSGAISHTVINGRMVPKK